MFYNLRPRPRDLLKCVAVLVFVCGPCSAESDDVEKLKNELTAMDSSLIDLATVLDKSLHNAFQISNSICLGESVVLPGIPVRGLAGYWTFDRLYPVDESGNGNHFYAPTVSGPPSNGTSHSPSGHGASLSFSSDSSYRIRAGDSLDLETFTLTFRIYLLGDYSSTFRNILSRNFYNLRSPSVLLYPYNNKLSVRVATTTGDVEGLSSNASLPLRRWTQVAVVCAEDALKIFINVRLPQFSGNARQLDRKAPLTSKGLRGKVARGSGELVMGRALRYDGFRVSLADAQGFVDELRVFSYAMGAHEVSAFVADSLSGFDSSFRVQLGCTLCAHSLASANGFCPSGYRLCSLDQLYISGAHVARANGWLHASNRIWYKDLRGVQDGGRAALCCS